MQSQKKVITNVIVSSGSQLITFALGIILPRIILVNWGSEYNGLLNSVATIMRYLSLLEAGMNTSTLQALYKSFSKKDNDELSVVVASAQHYYRRVALFYAGAVILTSFLFPLFLDTAIGYWTIFWVVVLQGCTGVINFAFRAAYQQLLNAEGRYYVISAVSLLTTVLTNSAKIISIVVFDSVIVMQLLGVLIMGIQVAIYAIYFKKRYSWINTNAKPDMSLLEHRKYYAVQQVAGLVFNSTDTLVLSVFCGLKVASVYTVYNMVYSALSMIIGIVRTSTNFVLGQAYHRSKEEFSFIYKLYTSFQVSLGSILSSCSVLLIISFVKLYTAGIRDVNYVNYYAPILFASNIILDCMRGASLSGANVAGQAPNTSWRYVLEAVLNLSISLALVKFLGMNGVLLGTVISGIWRSLDSIYYFYRNVLQEKGTQEYLFIVVNILLFCIASMGCISNVIDAGNYIQFFICAIQVFLVMLVVYGSVYLIYNRKRLCKLLALRKTKNKSK